MLNTVLLLLYVIIGLYLIIIPFEVIALPEFLTPLNEWIILLGGVLLIYIGLRFLSLKRKLKRIHASTALISPAQ